MNEYKAILDVYKDVLQQAEHFRTMSEDKQKAGDKTKDGGIVMRGHTDAERQVYADIAHELYKVVADLERTKEINPPKNKND